MTYPFRPSDFRSQNDFQTIKPGDRTPTQSTAPNFKTLAAASALGSAFYFKSPQELDYLEVGIKKANLGAARAGRWANLVGGASNLKSGDYFLNTVKRFEEETPFHIGRTFSASEILSPYILGKRAELTVPQATVQSQQRYFEALIGRSLQTDEFAGGLRVQGGRLWGLNQTGQLGQEPLLNYARVRLSHWRPGDQYLGQAAAPPDLHGRITQAYQNILSRQRGGVETAISSKDPFPFHIVGGKNWTEHYRRDAQAVAETLNTRFFKLLDDPFEFLGDIGAKLDNVPGFAQASRFFQKAGLKNRFGLGGRYGGSIASQWGRWLAPGFGRNNAFRPGALLTFVGAPFAYRAVDQWLRQSDAADGTTLQDGLGGFTASAWQKAMLARSQVGKYSGLSAIARMQEKMAPGSTETSTLAGLPLALATTGALAGFAKTRFWKRPADIGRVWESIKIPTQSFTSPLFAKMFPGRYNTAGKWGRAGLAVGLMLEAPFLIGGAARAVGGVKSPEDLRRIYSGAEEVPVSRSRWWEAGSSSWKGNKVDYYRPHWTVLAKSNYKAESLFNEDDGAFYRAAKMTPLISDLVDPYSLEKRHYHDRPYPLTGPSHPGLGIFGSLYAATLGKLLKPPAYMHEDEWRTQAGLKYLPREGEPAVDLGGLPPGEPVSPYSLKQEAAETWHRWTEASGLPGWLLRMATGSETWGTTEMQYASAERINSEERGYWDQNIGGLLGMTEWYRRINVKKRNMLANNEYNPLRNQMPSWIPGEKYFLDGQHGDIYGRVQLGEARLPGRGYEILHPEVAGVAPEDYPLLTRLKILGDVFPYSYEYQSHIRQARAQQTAGLLSAEEEMQVEKVARQVATIKKRKEFKEYEDWTERNWFERGPGHYWEMLTHTGEKALGTEALTPVRPLAKFIHARDAIEDYEKSMVYGPDTGFWDKPLSHFIRPAIYRTGKEMGLVNDVPAYTEKKRDVDEYFDKLRYLKARMHSQRARLAGDPDAAQTWETEASRTLMGASMQNYRALLGSLPKAERDYFQSFSAETNPKRQSKILEMVPENVARVYRMLWESKGLKQIQQEQATEADADKQAAYSNIAEALRHDLASGSRLTPELAKRYEAENPDQPLDTWLKEQELQEYFQDHDLPDTSWIGYDSRVDLEDVKLKVVQQNGMDYHDFSLWDTRERAILRKPYVEEAVEQMDEKRNPEEIRRQVHALVAGYGIKDIQVDVTPGTQPSNDTRVQITQDRDRQFARFLERSEHGDRKPARRKESRRANRKELRA